MKMLNGTRKHYTVKMHTMNTLGSTDKSSIVKRKTSALVPFAPWVLSSIVGALGFFYLPVVVLLPVAMMTNFGWLMVFLLGLGGAFSGMVVGNIVGRIQKRLLSDKVLWSSDWVRA